MTRLTIFVLIVIQWTMLKTFRKNMAPALERNSILLNSKILHPDALASNEIKRFLDLIHTGNWRLIRKKQPLI